MFLHYSQKQTAAELYNQIPACELIKQNTVSSPNKLIVGDILLVLKNLISEQQLAGKIDVVYLAPPLGLATQFSFSEEYTTKKQQQQKGWLHAIDFLEFLRARLFLLKTLLSEQGAIYIQVDSSIGHYVKIVMDEIFGADNFRNDISRICHAPYQKHPKAYHTIKDMVLFYNKSSRGLWNEDKRTYVSEDTVRLFPKIDANGRRYTSISLYSPRENFEHKEGVMPFRGIVPPTGQYWQVSIGILEQWDKDNLIDWTDRQHPRKKIYADEHPLVLPYDIWEDTKNNNLSPFIELMLRKSSLPNSYILDCYCGNSAATLQTAQLLGRKWIGIDESAVTIQAIGEKFRTNDIFSQKVTYELLKATSQEDDEDNLRYMLTKFF